jgi:uncharacterized repeat protein (TIGR01451 family)
MATITWGSGQSPTPITTQPQLQPTPASPTPISPPPSGGLGGTTPYTTPSPSSAPSGTPRLEIRLTNSGAATVAVGDYASFDLTVVNRGDATARNILVYDRFDAGLKHPGDTDNSKAISNNSLRDLAPGESTRLPITFEVAGTGTLCHEVRVSADGASPVTERACVTVQQAAVQDVITVQNVGSVPAANLELVQSFTNVLQAAPTTADQTVGQDGSLRIAVPPLAAGEVRTFRTQARCLSASAQACSRATVMMGGNVASQMEACLEILQQMP